ncbi:MAG: flagellin [Brevinematia bacterium]
MRDTDMANEMSDFVKNQILSQASISMIAQANARPQSILALLR